MNTSTINRALAGLAAGVFIASSALIAQDRKQESTNSQDSTIDTTRVYRLGEVVVSASRYPENAITAGRNVTVITREEIERGMYANVADALAGRQSMHLIGSRQTPGSLQQGFLRQAGSNHAIIMIDGIRISDPSTVNNSIDLSELSLAGVERIEIVRGSHSTLYGSSAIGGVVNIITRGKGANGLNGSLETSQGTFGSGTYSTTNMLHANYTLESGWYGNLGLSQAYSDGIDATTDTVSAPGVFNPQDRETFAKIDANARIGYKSDRSDFYVSYRKEDQRADVDQGAFNDDDNARVEFGRDLLGYGVSHRLSDEVELSFNGAWSGLGRYFVNDSSVINASGAYDGLYTETDAEGTLWENELTGTFALPEARFVVGAVSSRQAMTSRTYTFSSAFNFESETDLDSLGLEEVIRGGFAQAELGGALVSGALERFSLTVGGRFVDHNRFGGHWTYEINPKYRVGSLGTVYAALTTGFNAPSLYQLHAPEQSFGAYTNRGNAGLEPETSVSYEVGWKQWIGSGHKVSVSLYRRDVKNIIEYVYLWDGGVDTGSLSFADYLGDTYINLSRQEIRGLELAVQSQVLPSLSLGGGVNLSRSKHLFKPGDINTAYTGGHHVQVFESGAFVESEKELERLSRRPSISGNIQVLYNPVEALTIGVHTRYTGERYDVFYSSNLGPFGALDRSELSPYTITDIKLNYRISDQFTVGGKVQNTFNESYHELRGFNTTSRAFFVNGKIRFRSL